MTPIKLTESHFINPESIAHVCCNPKTAGDASAMYIVFTDRDQIPLELYGAEEHRGPAAYWTQFRKPMMQRCFRVLVRF